MPRKVVTGGEGQRVPLNMKTTPKVRAMLEAAAASSGRSLTQEVEYRIERSLDRESLFIEAFGSKLHSELMRALMFILAYGAKNTKLQKAERASIYISAIAAILAHANKPFEELFGEADRRFVESLGLIAVMHATGLSPHAAQKRLRSVLALQEDDE